jgi:3-deoxy-manno-octulosonate cytidylyltransferase (CMP-KDO synthetase)
MMDAVAVLPVRLESTRLPRKPMAELAGRPLLWHVWRQVLGADCFSSVVVATHSQEIVDLVESWGGLAVTTDSAFRNGTERIASIAPQLGARFMVNVQADMPRIDPLVFRELLRAWHKTRAEVVTPVYRLNTNQELHDPNVVKVVRRTDSAALYFSRHPIPYQRDVAADRWLDCGEYWGHVGIFGFTQAALRRYAAATPGALESAENLEQLRFLEIGVPIITVPVSFAPLRVDSDDDLARARGQISIEHSQRMRPEGSLADARKKIGDTH